MSEIELRVRHARCRGLPSEWWFPIKGTGRSNAGREAKKICRACPVQGECLVHAIQEPEPFGIWGGQGGARLRALRRIFAPVEDGGGRACDGWAWAWSDIDCECQWCQTVREVLGPDHVVLNANGPGARCGTPGSYAKGCRCPECEAAQSAYSRNKAA